MINGRYNVYFSESSFSSKWNLYLNMGHEYIHVAHMINLGVKLTQHILNVLLTNGIIELVNLSILIIKH